MVWSREFGLRTKRVWPWLVEDGWDGDGGEGVGGVGSSSIHQAVEFSQATRLAIVHERADP